MPRPELQRRIHRALIEEGEGGLDADDLTDVFPGVPEHIIAEELALMSDRVEVRPKHARVQGNRIFNARPGVPLRD